MSDNNNGNNNGKPRPVDDDYTFNEGADRLALDRVPTGSGSGRYTKCTPDRIQAITKDIELGLTDKDAALANDIDPATLWDWMKRGRIQAQLYNQDPDNYIPPSGERLFYLLYKSVSSAVSKRKQFYLERIRDAGGDPNKWQANAWILERLHTQEFGRQIKVEVNDWRRDAIELIRKGLEFEQAVLTFGEQAARELFTEAGHGVPVADAKIDESESQIVDAEFSEVEAESGNDNA